MEEILEILQEVRPDVDFLAEDRLIDDDILDSFDIITIVGEFNEEFDIEIDVEDLEPENFNTVAAMQELIDKLQSE
ncbi:MAG: phosphopantetheine-binding protein [Coriobacteriales bacterium]|nr:phosphopantetheine-binding protein [Coriobacteriales bacterium]